MTETKQTPVQLYAANVHLWEKCHPEIKDFTIFANAAAHFAGLGRSIKDVTTEEIKVFEKIRQEAPMLFLEALGNVEAQVRWYRGLNILEDDNANGIRTPMEYAQVLYLAARGCTATDLAFPDKLASLLAGYPLAHGTDEEDPATQDLIDEEEALANDEPSAMAFFLKHQA